MSVSDWETTLLEEEYEITKEVLRLFSRRRELNESWDEFLRVGRNEQVVLDGFPQFSRLPIELRCIIWECAVVPLVQEFFIEERDLRVPAHRLPANTWSCSTHHTPSISRVSHESREVFLRHYAVFETANNSRFFMSPTLDTWFFNFPDLDHQLRGPAQQIREVMETFANLSSKTDFASKIKSMALSMADWEHYPWDDPEWNIIDFFSGLEEIVFVENRAHGYEIAEQEIQYFTEYCPRHRIEHRTEEEAAEQRERQWGLLYHDCLLNTGKQGGRKTFLAPFHEGELIYWERSMALVGCLKALAPGKKLDTVRVSVARLLEGAELERRGPLVNFEGVRFGPPNVSDDWIEWKEEQEREQEEEQETGS